MKFKGKLWGVAFSVKEADSPVELFRILADEAEDRSNCRGWVLVKSARQPYWLEIMLDDSTMFHIVFGNDQLVLDRDGHISVEFRRKPCNSPNTSPSKEEFTAGTVLDSRSEEGSLVAATQSLSTIRTLSSDEKTHSDIAYRNSVDPFTRCSFAEIETPLVLRFPPNDSTGVDAIFVDQESFEEYVQRSEKEGKSFDQLRLSNVELKDGTIQDLNLTWEIWVGSVLPSSKQLRGSYFMVNVAEKNWESKLRRIKENPSLSSRITFWIADFGDSEALQRLEMLSDDPDVPPFMGPFYFSKEEAVRLGKLEGTSSVLLGDALRAKSSTSTCAAHDLKPFLEQVFRLNPSFHQDPGFRKKKKAWVAARNDALQINQTRPVKKAAPTFGAFGIR